MKYFLSFSLNRRYSNSYFSPDIRGNKFKNSDLALRGYQIHQIHLKNYFPPYICIYIIFIEFPCIFLAELGDYQSDEHGPGYLTGLTLIPGQSADLEAQIAELHRLHRGQTPADAEFNFLDHAKRLGMYVYISFIFKFWSFQERKQKNNFIYFFLLVAHLSKPTITFVFHKNIPSFKFDKFY